MSSNLERLASNIASKSQSGTELFCINTKEILTTTVLHHQTASRNMIFSDHLQVYGLKKVKGNLKTKDPTRKVGCLVLEFDASGTISKGIKLRPDGKLALVSYTWQKLEDEFGYQVIKEKLEKVRDQHQSRRKEYKFFLKKNHLVSTRSNIPMVANHECAVKNRAF